MFRTIKLEACKRDPGGAKKSRLISKKRKIVDKGKLDVSSWWKGESWKWTNKECRERERERRRRPSGIYSQHLTEK